MGKDSRIDLYSLNDEELQEMHDDLVKEDRDYFMINLIEEELTARGLWEDDDYDEDVEEESDYHEEDECGLKDPVLALHKVSRLE